VIRRAVILGASSAIGQALARQLAAEGWDLVLAARRAGRIEPLAADLRLRTDREVTSWELEALDEAGAADLPARLRSRCGDFELVVQVFGYLGDQQRAQRDTGELSQILASNFSAAAILLEPLARYLEERGQPGGIIGIGSVAGDRGRQSNYAYGAAKGALALYLQGLRNRLARRQVHVLTVKPGFVDTPMTEGLPGLFLVASPEAVARDILRAYKRKRDVVYTPWFWRWLMWVVRCIPERLFKRLRL
jgi:short-subunit dehydrogenase